jgi:hypothetical protein
VALITARAVNRPFIAAADIPQPDLTSKIYRVVGSRPMQAVRVMTRAPCSAAD